MYKLAHIHKSYADKTVLENVSLTLYNEVVALIGENGAGKTTLLQILRGKLQPDDGHVEKSGVVGYVPQQPPFKSTISACFQDGIETWRIETALEQVTLKKPLDFLVKSLSGGQKTRLSIATVLAQEPAPDLLLLDEPTNNLDKKALSWLTQYVKSFKGAIVIVSHDRKFINATSSKIFELKDGRITEYTGNYDAYKTQKDIEHAHKLESYETYRQEKETGTPCKGQKTTNEQYIKTKVRPPHGHSKN